MKNQSEIVDFFREVQRVISKHGLSKVLVQLRNLQIDLEGFEKDVCEYIISTTSNHYSILKEDLLHSNLRGKIAEARRMCFALIKEHLPFSDEKIGNIFSRSKQYVHQELKSLPLNQNKLTTKHEAKFVNDFMIITKEILTYKNAYNNNNI